MAVSAGVAMATGDEPGERAGAGSDVVAGHVARQVHRVAGHGAEMLFGGLPVGVRRVDAGELQGRADDVDLDIRQLADGVQVRCADRASAAAPEGLLGGGNVEGFAAVGEFRLLGFHAGQALRVGADVLADLHGAELRAAHGAEMATLWASFGSVSSW